MSINNRRRREAWWIIPHGRHSPAALLFPAIQILQLALGLADTPTFHHRRDRDQRYAQKGHSTRECPGDGPRPVEIFPRKHDSQQNQED